MTAIILKQLFAIINLIIAVIISELKEVYFNFTFLGFCNWFNPAMLRELATETQRTQSFSFLRDLRDSVAKIFGNPFGKGILPTSCRFNPVSRHPYSVGKTDNGHESRTWCTAPKQILPNQNSSEQRAASNQGFSSSLNSHYSLLATKLIGGKNE